MGNAAFYMVLRRMRGPLLVLIGSYALGILVLMAIPGEHPDGEPWRMNFIDALYFLTYTAPTIGFGEYPHEFNYAQRFGYMLAIYPPVIAWFYAIVTIVGLIQDPVFRRTVEAGRFRRRVRRLSDPFWIVCGYGDTGSLLVRSLTERGWEASVLDTDRERIAELETRDLRLFVPGWQADANGTENLRAAGLDHPQCAGVLAVTNDDHTNLQIAITVKLLHPEQRVICRAENRATADNMASFGTDHVVDPFSSFADRLALAITKPEMHRVYEWLSGMPNTPLFEPPRPPSGRWLICGYGRFGKAVCRRLDKVNVPYTVIERTPEQTGAPEGTIYGKGTEAVTLREAGIERAEAVLAGTDDDADNLSIVMTARDIKPDLYLTARENQMAHRPLFKAAQLQMPVEPSYLIATRMLSLITAPLLPEFLRIARGFDRSWHAAVARRIREVSAGRVPEIWTLTVSEDRSPAIIELHREGAEVCIGDILADPQQSGQGMNAVALLLVRPEAVVPLPDSQVPLEAGDRLLCCGTSEARAQLRWTLFHRNTLRFLITGEQRPDGSIWRWLGERR
ncbi:potassium channel family protein [Halorhodospira halophila]|uniref:TrkA-N domain protein n=1 Tax=Halorhodospira halophila (strain DSM 244 / SL1) TaxID=349124 RepID=A1WZD8_HALHL|nr:potassium channel protein [Halorhodospira halophila]ABM63050.1 TrkA-N domain protein [Halorhodospira halophila SL1]MBK1727828.1 potassium transporter TrkA [Halorhodospira halophila]